MENVRIAILSTYDQVCAFMDNSLPRALHFYSDEVHSYREGAANTFEFTASARHKDSKYLVEGNKLSFVYRNKDYYFNIVKVVRTEQTVEVTGYSLMFELLNDESGEYKAERAMTFAEYMEVFDPDDTVVIGINEVSDKSISNEWTGTSTLLARIYSLANVFGAEVEFVPELNKDYSLRRLVMNVYKEHDGECQGIGRRRTDITLRYGKNVEGITKTSDIIDLRTKIKPTGKDGLTITSLDKKELDVDGNVEFLSPAGDGCIYAVQARDRFPSNLLDNGSDRYILAIWSYDTDNVNTLYGQALAELKKLCEPSIEYKVDGYFDTDIGDTVSIVDEEFTPALYLEARVTEQVRSFTDQTRNKTTFDNYKELQSQIDPSLLAQMQKLIEENKMYTCMISTDNGITFKNGDGTTTLSANVRDGATDVIDKVQIVWSKDGSVLATGNTITVNASDIDGKALYRFEAQDSNGNLKGFYEVTVANVSDGEKGDTGATGADGNDAEIIRLHVSSNLLNKSADGTFKTGSVVANAKKKVGNNEETDYLGRFKWETTKDNTTWTQKFVSSADRANEIFEFGTGMIEIESELLKAIRVSLYEAGGTDVLLDQVTIPVVEDGKDGADGKNGDPTGITVSETEPTSKYTGMLWKHTGTVSGLIQNATYRWNGSEWELYMFIADNIDVDSIFAKDIKATGTIEGLKLIGTEAYLKDGLYLKYSDSDQGEHDTEYGKAAYFGLANDATALYFGSKDIMSMFLVSAGNVEAIADDFVLTTDDGSQISLLNLKRSIPVFITGTMVVAFSGQNYAKLWTSSEMQELLSAKGAKYDSYFQHYLTIVAINGDGSASSLPVVGVEYYGGSYDAWYAYLNSTFTGPYRINYTIIYDPSYLD